MHWFLKGGGMVSARFLFFGVLLVTAAVSVQAEANSSLSVETIEGGKIVKDSATKLIWQQNTADTNEDGAVTTARYPEGDKVPWQKAMNFCQGLNYAGSPDWRLPKIVELDSLVDFTRSYPAINPIFGCEADAYWSATVAADSSTKAQYVHFNFGSDSSKPKAKMLFVRCVRNTD